MSIRNRKCFVCGKEYEYCPNCWNDRLKPSYMTEFDCENCKNIFDICTRFNMKLNTKEESEILLSKCDLSDKDNFDEQIQLDIKNITYHEEEKPVVQNKNNQNYNKNKNNKKNNKNKHGVVTTVKN